MKFSAFGIIAAVAAYDEKVQIDLYYESQCPACRDQVTRNFKTAMNTPGFLDMADVRLHPYGNARETLKSDNTWAFSCQHGEAECQYNYMETCALNYQTNWLQTFNFIACVEGQDYSTNYDSVAQTCAAQNNITDVNSIQTCMRSTMGNTLEHKVALQTDALVPSHRYVPWLVANGQHTDAIQNDVGSNLLSYVCRNYKGTKRADACSQAFPVADVSKDMLNVCYKDGDFPKVGEFLY